MTPMDPGPQDNPLFVPATAGEGNLLAGLGYQYMGLGAGYDYQSALSQAKARLSSEVGKLAEQAGQRLAKPIVAEGQAQSKSYLPWIILGFIGVTALGGLFGGLGVRSRSRR